MAQVINFDGGITKSEVEILISGTTAGKQDTDSVRAQQFFNTHPLLDGKYLTDYHIDEIADWADYLAWLDAAWSNIGISGKLPVPWAADEMVDIIAYDPDETIGGLFKLIRNGLVYLFETTGSVSWTIMQLATGDVDTSALEEALAAIGNDLNDRKQNKLIAGQGITISGDTISAQGGSGEASVVVVTGHDDPEDFTWEEAMAIHNAFNAGKVVLLNNEGEYAVIKNSYSNIIEGGYGMVTFQYEIGMHYTAVNIANDPDEGLQVLYETGAYQESLTAGEGIVIEDNVISATGGGGGDSTKLDPVDVLPDPVEDDLRIGTVMTSSGGSVIVEGEYIPDYLVIGPDISNWDDQHYIKFYFPEDASSDIYPQEDIDEMFIWQSNVYPTQKLKISYRASDKYFVFYEYDESMAGWAEKGSTYHRDGAYIYFYHFSLWYSATNVGIDGRYYGDLNFASYEDLCNGTVTGNSYIIDLDTRHFDALQKPWLPVVNVEYSELGRKYPEGTVINASGAYSGLIKVENGWAEQYATTTSVGQRIAKPDAFGTASGVDDFNWESVYRPTNTNTGGIPQGTGYGLYTHMFAGDWQHVLSIYEPADGSGDRYARVMDVENQTKSNWKKASAIDSNIPTIKRLTSDEYDELETKDVNTLYIIVDE